MIVCHCHGVTDREIRDSVRCGARSCDDVADSCGAGSGCGGCQELVAEIVASERRHLTIIRAEVMPARAPALHLAEGARQSA